MEKNKLRDIKKKKERKSIIVFNAEGKNKTEKIYLSRFSSRNITIKCPSGNSTDPKNMYSELKKFCEENEYGKNYGDELFLLIDSDINSQKMLEIDKIRKKCDDLGIKIIISTPTFEVWFLNHYKYSTHEYKNGDEVEKALKEYINDYSKSEDVFDLISDKTNTAIKNSLKLEKYHTDLGHDVNGCDSNPYTATYKVIDSIEMIEEKNKNNNE